MKAIGITGGIGCGKSTICKIFRTLGIPVYQADQEAKIITNTDKQVIMAIKDLLGDGSFSDGRLDRQKVAEIVFNNNSLLNKLNAIIHPKVKEGFAKWILEQEAPYVLKEAALIFETNDSDLDKVILVTAPRELRLKRVLQRDPHRNRKQILAIIDNQLSENTKLNLADFIISNDGIKSVLKQVLSIHQQLSL